MNTEWPSLEYESWKDTYETLHRWLQMVGKVRTHYSPWVNHSWNSTLYITSCGFTTLAIPLGTRSLTIEVDLLEHQLVFSESTGMNKRFPLTSESVASFYKRFCKVLREFGVEPSFSGTPNELMDATPFEKDSHHCTYRPEDARRCFEVIVIVSNIMQEFRAGFEGKSSPVHFFWGSFDLAVTRFSGRKAPEHPGGFPHLNDEIAKEGYSHEVMSCGFWPGNEMYPRPAFYAYAYPVPTGLDKSDLCIEEAYYHPELREFILDYEAVRTSNDPRQLLLTFFESAFKEISTLANWDKEVMDLSPYLERIQERFAAH